MHALLALSTQSLLDPNFLRRLFLEKNVLTFAPMWPNLVTAVSPRSFPLIRSLSCVFIYWSSGLYIRCWLPSQHQPSCAEWVDVRVRCLPSRVEDKHCAQGLSMFDPTVSRGQGWHLCCVSSACFINTCLQNTLPVFWFICFELRKWNWAKAKWILIIVILIIHLILDIFWLQNCVFSH